MQVFKGLKDLGSFVKQIRKRGMVAAVRTARDAVRLRVQLINDQKFDQNHCVDTCGIIPLEKLSLKERNTEHCVYYDPTPVSMVERILDQLTPNLSDFVFVDFGSGKGRILLLASKKSFKQIIGIEFSKELDLIASQNIRAFKNSDQVCHDIKCICIDARDFELPQSKCVLFFYRPFEGPVFQQVFEKIEVSWRENPRKMFLIYLCPFSSDPFKNVDFLHKIPLRRRLYSFFLPDPIEAVLYESRESLLRQKA